ncbi:MAG TPA: oxidoreductase [Bacteroidia bacterium]|jgi:photosystem II stability/assembly factor-like uncharacterized protein|nr:oxidoreductase [Bacteroidia bacterium]
MKKNIFLLFISIIFFANIHAQTDSAYAVQYFNAPPSLSIRALQVIGEAKAWFAANHGVWGYTENGGRTWHIDSIKVDTVYPQFRSIAVLNDSTVLLLSVASPAYLFKTTNKGKTWRLVFKNADRDIFFDCMKFYNAENGIAIADPKDGCCLLIKTKDGGESWKKVDCANIPRAKEGEACFAASNSNIAVYKNNVWFATGGMHARVFHSVDNGNHFEAYESPLPQGEQMTGIFSIDFLNEKTGIIAGGNYVKSDTSVICLALTHDGGKTWMPIKSKKPIFGSCVQFRNAAEFYITGQDGTFKCNIQSGKITELKDKSGEALKFNTLRFSASGKALWLAGSKGNIALIRLH